MRNKKLTKPKPTMERALCSKIGSFIATWERMAEAYFMDPPYKEEERQNIEKYNSKELHFTFGGHKYDAVINVKCNLVRVTAKRELLVDGVKKNITPLKRLLTECVSTPL